MAGKGLSSGLCQMDFRDQHGGRHRRALRSQKHTERALREKRSRADKRKFVAPKTAPTFEEIAEASCKSTTLDVYTYFFNGAGTGAVSKLARRLVGEGTGSGAADDGDFWDTSEVEPERVGML